MSGGKSSSSTETKTTQTTNASDASGVVGDVLQGQIEYNVSEEFGDNVADAFRGLIDLANNVAEGAGTIANQSIEKVAERSLQSENPELAGDINANETSKIVLTAGIVMIGVVGAIYFMRKR